MGVVEGASTKRPNRDRDMASATHLTLTGRHEIKRHANRIGIVMALIAHTSIICQGQALHDRSHRAALLDGMGKRGAAAWADVAA